MIDEVLQSYFASYYRVNKAISELGHDPADVNYIKVNDQMATVDSSDIIRDYVKTIEGVEGCGYFTEFNTRNIEGIESVEIVCAEKQIASLGNLMIREEQRTALEKDWGGYEPVLLGCEYRDSVKVGTVFTLSYFHEEKDCVVAGFLKKGAAWPQRESMILKGADGSDSYTLDNKGILITDNFSRYDNYMGEAHEIYYIADYNKNLEIRQDIMDFAIDNKIGIGIFNIGELIEKELEDKGISKNKTFTAAILLLILAIVSVSASSVIYCLINKAEHGIMMICGISKRNISLMIIMQNALIYVAAAISAWIIRQYEIFGTLLPNKKEAMFETMFLQEFVPHNIYMPVILLGVVIIMLFISSLLPGIIIGRETLIGLIYNRK